VGKKGLENLGGGPWVKRGTGWPGDEKRKRDKGPATGKGFWGHGLNCPAGGLTVVYKLGEGTSRFRGKDNRSDEKRGCRKFWDRRKTNLTK